MDENRLKILLKKYQEQNLSAGEKAELDDWFHTLNLGGTGFDDWLYRYGGEENYIENRFADLELLVSKRKSEKPARIRWAVAASILLLLSAGAIFFTKQRKPQQQIVQLQKQDIAPGGNKAVLILANGEKISLAYAHPGSIAQQANMQVRKTSSGQIVYIINSNNAATALATNSKAKAAVYNTVETPRGGQTSVSLSDGTIAYLDAASSIKFPVSFTGNERKVEVTGQVYFEVVHNGDKPFKVEAKGQNIEDIGTHFNINAYDDEPVVKTTLLEGCVKITDQGESVVLKPGQQAITSLNKPGIKISNTDLEDVIAWKNGYFMFESESIQEIMRKIARWYKVDIIYAGSPPTDKFWGTVSRFANASQVLNKLELTDKVHFKIEGRRIIVSQ
jgi:transmembrane sensor